MMGLFSFLCVGSLRDGGIPACAALRFQVFQHSQTGLRVKLTLLAAAGVGFSSLLMPLLPQLPPDLHFSL